MKQSTRTALEMGPLLLFFFAYKWQGLITATGVLVAATAVTVIINYILEKKVPIMPLVSALVLGIFGLLTILNDDELYIKLKPTIVNLLFATILFGGALKKKGLLQHLMGNVMHMSDKAWHIFSIRWGFLFLFLAGMNEFIWRTFDTDFWVKFKVFGMLPITLVFMMTQIPFLQKHMKQPPKDEK